MIRKHCDVCDKVLDTKTYYTLVLTRYEYMNSFHDAQVDMRNEFCSVQCTIAALLNENADVETTL